MDTDRPGSADSDVIRPSAETFGEVMALVVHDLRNPMATLTANLSFIQEILDPPHAGLSQSEEQDLREALDDTTAALNDLSRGLDHFTWIARWMAGMEVARPHDADIVTELCAASQHQKNLRLDLEIPVGTCVVKGGSALPKLLNTLLANSEQHAPGAAVRLSARRDGSTAVVEICDQGTAIASELREHAFTLEGQRRLKGRRDGRYGRVLGLFAAKALAQAMGAQLEADEQRGHCVFRLRLPVTE